MENHSIVFSNGRIHYSKFGKGSFRVIAFHGFGQDSTIFQKVADRLPEYQFIALDLPFHGKSTLFGNRKPIMPHEVVEMVTQLTEEQEINSFSIMAFSIGSRFAWPLLSAFKDRLDSVTLIAPDGLPTSNWYRFATFSKLSRWFFRKVMNNENIIQGIIKTAMAIGMTDRQSSVYINKTIGTADMRKRTYDTWTALRFLNPDRATLVNMIKNNGTRVQIILGEKDNLINSKLVIRKLKGIAGLDIVLLPCKHHELLERYTTWRMENNDRAIVRG